MSLRCLGRGLLIWAAATSCAAEDAELCESDDCTAILLLQDRLTVASPGQTLVRLPVHPLAQRRPKGLHVRATPVAPALLAAAAVPSAVAEAQSQVVAHVPAPPSAASLLQSEVEELQAELAAEEQLLTQQSSKYVVAQSAKHFTGILIGLVMAASVLVFGICMSMSLGILAGGSEGEAARRRVGCGDWAMAVGISAVLLVVQLTAFHQIGLLAFPSEGDFSPQIVVLSVLISCIGPVACLACFKFHTSLEHLDGEFGAVDRRFDRLEKIVSAGFTTSLREEQAVLQSIKRQLGR